MPKCKSEMLPEGNYRKATEQYINLLLEVIEKEPEELGYEFGNWTAARLSTHLEKETGISLSSSQIRRILKAKKYLYFWSKYSWEEGASQFCFLSN